MASPPEHSPLATGQRSETRGSLQRTPCSRLLPNGAHNLAAPLPEAHQSRKEALSPEAHYWTEDVSCACLIRFETLPQLHHSCPNAILHRSKRLIQGRRDFTVAHALKVSHLQWSPLLFGEGLQTSGYCHPRPGNNKRILLSRLF